MNIKYQIFFFISVVLISCGKKSKLTELKNDEKLVIDRVEHGCTHYQYYIDSIKYINEKYYVEEYELIDTTKLKMRFKSVKRKLMILDENSFENYIDSITDYYYRNSRKGTTTSYRLVILKKQDTILEIGNYYNQ